MSQVPVDPGTAIRQTLLALEGKQCVKVLYAVESGSRAWGFASADSDYDVRFIYHRPVEAYVRLERPRDVIELPIWEGIDVSGWDIFKAAALLRKSNPPLIEWLGSPIVYQEDSSVTAVLREQCARHFSRRACGEHYLSMARNNYQGSIRGQPGGQEEEIPLCPSPAAVPPMAARTWHRSPRRCSWRCARVSTCRHRSASKSTT